MNLYKVTYFTSLIISISAMCLVALITNGNNDLLDPLLMIAYGTMILIISSVWLSLIIKSIKNQKNQKLKTILFCLSFLAIGLMFFYSYSQIYLLASSNLELYIWFFFWLYIYSLVSFTVFFIILPNKKLWPVIILASICYFLANGNEEILRDGSVLTSMGSKMISTGLFMFYSLVLVAISIMMFFGIKNMNK